MADKRMAGPSETMPVPTGSIRIRGATSGRVDDVTFCSAPSKEAGKLARFVSTLAHRQHKNVLRPRTFRRMYSDSDDSHLEQESSFVVRWFRPDGSGRLGFAGPDDIALCTSLRGKDLVEATLHECRHTVQYRTKVFEGDSGLRERDAAAYAQKWAPAYAAAYRASGGYEFKCSFASTRPPWYDFRSGHVVLNTTDARAYDYRPRRKGNAWMRLSHHD